MNDASHKPTRALAGSWSRDLTERRQTVAQVSAARRWPGAVGALLLLALFSFHAPTPEAAIREDEVECEEAVAHLVKCCPSFDAHLVSCDYDEVWGCGPTRVPELDVAASRSVRALSCADALASGWCSYAQPGTR